MSVLYMYNDNYLSIKNIIKKKQFDICRLSTVLMTDNLIPHEHWYKSPLRKFTVLEGKEESEQSCWKPVYGIGSTLDFY